MSESNESIPTQLARVALWVSILGSFLTPFMGSAINVALPEISKEFNMNAIALGWVATSYLLAAAIVLVPIGRMADIHGRKRIYLLGIIIYTTASLFCGLASNGTQLIVYRVIQGFGGAMMFSTATAILVSVYPAEKRGKALGLVVASVYIALSAGPFLGGFMTHYLGWRSIFLFNIPLGLVVIGLVLGKLKGEWAEARGEKFDWIGSFVYAVSILGVIYGLSVLPSLQGAIYIAIGMLFFVIFFILQTKLKYPVLDLHHFTKNRVFAFSNLAALINYSATFAVAFLLSLYLQYVKGMEPQQAGLILVAQPVMMALFSPLAGRLSDKLEARLLASAGMAITVIGLTILAFFNENTSIGSILFSLILLGFGFALFSSPNTNAVMSSVEKRFLGLASATLSTMRLTGQMFSMGIAMLIMNIYIGKMKINMDHFPNFLSAMKLAFVVFAIMCVIGVFASLVRGKEKKLLSS
ncbi:MAG: MFS transporter [Bacteroidetes bacterium]|nr:MFS transporter [Bacteroidota bacterium]